MRDFFEKVIHFFAPSKCVPHFYINNEADLICSCCGRKFGFVYGWDPVRVFVFEKYIRHKKAIEKYVRLHAQKPDEFGYNVRKNANILDGMIDKAAHFLDDNMIGEDECNTEEGANI